MLHRAAEEGPRSGSTAAAGLLQDKGSDISAKNKVGGTVLHQAAGIGYLTVMRLL
jgi:ankyrin repeat protein